MEEIVRAKMNKEKKTFYIRKKDCKNLGWAYEIEGKIYDGNLIIDVDKIIVVKGYQRVEGYQVVKGKTILGMCKWRVTYYKTKITIGCETKTTQNWIEWFKSDAEYETSRNSLAFNQIYKTFLMAKVAQENDEGLK